MLLARHEENETKQRHHLNWRYDSPFKLCYKALEIPFKIRKKRMHQSIRSLLQNSNKKKKKKRLAKIKMDAQLAASDSSSNQNLVFRPKVNKLVAQSKPSC